MEKKTTNPLITPTFLLFLLIITESKSKPQTTISQSIHLLTATAMVYSTAWVVAVARTSADLCQYAACNPERLSPDEALAAIFCLPVRVLGRLAVRVFSFFCFPLDLDPNPQRQPFAVRYYYSSSSSSFSDDSGSSVDDGGYYSAGGGQRYHYHSD